MRSQSETRSWIASIGLSLGALVFTMALLEMALRIAGVGADYHRPRQDILQASDRDRALRGPFNYIPNSTVRSIYDSNPRGYFGPENNVDHAHNSVGWRDVEHSLAKPAGTYRILGLGDSYLWGQGVWRDDICLTRLEQMLGETFRQRRIETINAGLSGKNTANERDLLLSRGLAYDPDLVVVHFVLNDVEVDLARPGPKIEFFTNYTSVYLAPDWLTNYSSLWAWGKQRYLAIVRGRAYIRDCVNSFNAGSSKWRQCRDALDDIQRICRENRIKLLVVIFPFFYHLNGDYPFQSIHDVVRGHCEQQGIPVVDLRPQYGGHEGADLWVHPSDQHPNETAHEIAAKAMANYLTEHAEEFNLH